MTTPNLDATGHWWVGALARFNFQLEYQKRCDNTIADVLSWITTHLDPNMVRSILNGINLGAAHQAEVHEPCHSWGWSWLGAIGPCCTAGHVSVQMHMTDWAEAQREDPVLSTALDWLEAQKKTDLKTLLGEHASSEEGQLILQNWQNFTIHQKAKYLHSMPKGDNEDLLLFVVPKAHAVGSLLWMDAIEMQDIRICDLYSVPIAGTLLVAGNDQPDVAIHQDLCMHCLQHEGGLSKAPLHPIMATTLSRSLTCRFYQHKDHLGARQVT